MKNRGSPAGDAVAQHPVGRRSAIPPEAYGHPAAGQIASGGRLGTGLSSQGSDLHRPAALGSGCPARDLGYLAGTPPHPARARGGLTCWGIPQPLRAAGAGHRPPAPGSRPSTRSAPTRPTAPAPGVQSALSNALALVILSGARSASQAKVAFPKLYFLENSGFSTNPAPGEHSCRI